MPRKKDKKTPQENSPKIDNTTAGNENSLAGLLADSEKKLSSLKRHVRLIFPKTNKHPGQNKGCEHAPL